MFCRHPQKSVSLRQLPQDTLGSSVLSVKVNVLPANPPDPSLRAAIDDIEFLRSDKEKDMFEAVRADHGLAWTLALNSMSDALFG